VSAKSLRISAHGHPVTIVAGSDDDYISLTNVTPARLDQLKEVARVQMHPLLQSPTVKRVSKARTK